MLERGSLLLLAPLLLFVLMRVMTLSVGMLGLVSLHHAVELKQAICMDRR